MQDKPSTSSKFSTKSMVGVLASFVMLFGCSDSKEPKVYRLAKVDKKTALQGESTTPEKDFGGVPPPPKPSAPVKWTTPSSWQELPASGMRIASFAVNEDMGSLDISLIFLGGAAGGDLSNVNRWREQLHEKPWSYEELNSQVREEVTPLGNAKVVTFSASNGEALLAAIIPYQTGTWFLKMVGPKALVEKHKTQFYSVLKSLQSAHE